jgi:hypothetical protein
VEETVMADADAVDQDLGEIAVAIVNGTRVVSDAEAASPGRPVHIEVLPGSVQEPVAGYLSLEMTDPIQLDPSTGVPKPEPPRITGTLTGFRSPPRFDVAYSVRRGGHAAADDEWTRIDRVSRPAGSSLSPPPATDVDILLRPPLVGEAHRSYCLSYEIHVAITVTVSTAQGSASAAKVIAIPVRMRPLVVPAVLLLGSLGSFSHRSTVGGVEHVGSLAVILQPGSPSARAVAHETIACLVAELQQLVESVAVLKPVLPWSEQAHAKATEVLNAMISEIRGAPRVFAAAGNIDDLGDVGSGFAALASSLMLLGTGGPTVTLYREGAFGGSHKTFVAASPQPLPEPLALLIEEDFATVPWDGEESGSIDDLATSLYWGTAIQ